MWMRGYNDGGDQFSSNEDNSFGSRKFRPLMPRPGTGNSPGLARIYSHDLLTLNHHLAMVEQNKREICVGQQVIVSSRWNPTPEQLQTLEELYRRGTRTPSAEQIQYITAQLRRYGKIEGKNVFYWFQNHKARERQKRRRQESTSDELPSNYGDRKEPSPGGRGNRRAVAAGIEVEETKNWVSSTNSRTLAEYEKSVSRRGGARTGGAAEAESKGAAGAGAGGWLQFDEDADPSEEGSGATWRMMHLSYPPSPRTLIPVPHTSSSSSSSTCPCSAPPNTSSTTTLHSSPLLNTATHHHFIDMFATDHTHTTLQLFPMPNHQHDDQGQNGNEATVEAMTTANSGYQFFEFLPLKT